MNLQKPNLFSFLGLITVSILFTSFIVPPYQSNTDPLSTWDKTTLQQANTALSATYMSSIERNVIFYTNLCRMKPKKFGETVLQNYVKKNNVESSASLTSLREELNTDAPLTALSPDKDLYTVAHDFAIKMGKEGKTGHEGFQERMKEVLTKYNRVGENCSYGDTSAIDCVIALLIDTSDPNHLMHRKNMLDSKFSVIGVSKQPHKVYGCNIVMDFAGNTE